MVPPLLEGSEKGETVDPTGSGSSFSLKKPSKMPFAWSNGLLSPARGRVFLALRMRDDVEPPAREGRWGLPTVLRKVLPALALAPALALVIVTVLIVVGARQYSLCSRSTNRSSIFHVVVEILDLGAH